jgi:hypothetical protein
LDASNLTWAELFVDGADFRHLPLKRDERAEERLQVSAQAFQMTYGIPVPYKVNEQASSGLSALFGGSNAVQVKAAESNSAGLCGWLGTCQGTTVS